MSDFGSGGGQPPGGGFGPPPSGDFGAPPSGGGGAENFGAPSSGGPGAGGPLAHIPFTPADEANLSGMARFAKLAGIAAVVSAFLQAVAQVVQGFVLGSSDAGRLFGQVCGAFIALGLASVLALFLFKASTAVQKVVATDDADQENLVAALESLKVYFIVKGVVAILVICLFCVVVALVVAFGTMLASIARGI